MKSAPVHKRLSLRSLTKCPGIPLPAKSLTPCMLTPPFLCIATDPPLSAFRATGRGSLCRRLHKPCPQQIQLVLPLRSQCL
ncbi:hypothetical protein AB205_0181960 [Aquarana catesbeiana]|uniref:Uncharacterized protein n=1 Tax=Aquarana catesbeiana TaxID=8400 RepID=A0A2G9S1E6_AQUCT|nr:hypothetical protein AB205_0181960 [Aquarana catesbeiana]